MLSAPLQTFVPMLAGWVNEEQRAVIDYSPLPSSNIGIRRVPKPARSTQNDMSVAPRTHAGSPIHARLSFGTGREHTNRHVSVRGSAIPEPAQFVRAPAVGAPAVVTPLPRLPPYRLPSYHRSPAPGHARGNSRYARTNPSSDKEVEEASDL